MSSVDLGSYFSIPDPRTREAFRLLYQNTRSLQDQLDSLKNAVITADSLDDLKTKVEQLDG